MEHVRQLIGSFHFEINVNRTNFEQAIADRYELFAQKANYKKLTTLGSDFYDISSDIGLFHLFNSAIEYTKYRNEEAYVDIKTTFWKMLNCFEQIVFSCNSIMISIEVILVHFISFYKYLMQDSEYEKAAYAILQDLNYKQTEDIFVPLEHIAEQQQDVKSTIEEFVLKYTLAKKQFEAGHIKRLQRPVYLLQTSLLGLVTNVTVYVKESYKRAIEAMKGRLMMHTVKRANSKSWENQETKKLFVEYYTNLLALSLSCKDVKSVFEDLLLNFQSFLHAI